MSDTTKYCLVWVNLKRSKWGNGNLHVTSILELIKCCRNGFKNNAYPNEIFDGFWCINESIEGRENFTEISEFLLQQKDPENTLLELFSENNGNNLMKHPLLSIKKHFFNNKLKEDLEQVKCFVVNENYNTASKNLTFYSNKMLELIWNI